MKIKHQDEIKQRKKHVLPNVVGARLSMFLSNSHATCPAVDIESVVAQKSEQRHSVFLRQINREA